MKNNFLFLFTFSILIIIIITCQKNHCIQVGTTLSEFEKIEWINSREITSQKLKGKVVLIRWWTDECIYCINSADALNDWQIRYQKKDFQILGLYHVKPFERKVETEEIREFAREKGFQFPIGYDRNWINLRKYWTECHSFEFTSISILMDKRGIIRYIHEGGEYHKELLEGHAQCVNDYEEIDSLIQKLLEE